MKDKLKLKRIIRNIKIVGARSKLMIICKFNKIIKSVFFPKQDKVIDWLQIHSFYREYKASRHSLAQHFGPKQYNIELRK
jgi:hypothetical protein